MRIDWSEQSKDYGYDMVSGLKWRRMDWDCDLLVDWSKDRSVWTRPLID